MYLSSHISTPMHTSATTWAPLAQTFFTVEGHNHTSWIFYITHEQADMCMILRNTHFTLTCPLVKLTSIEMESDAKVSLVTTCMSVLLSFSNWLPLKWWVIAATSFINTTYTRQGLKCIFKWRLSTRAQQWKVSLKLRIRTMDMV